MDLLTALRLREKRSSAVISLTGAGGKTSAMFRLANDYIKNGYHRVFLTHTTHLGEWQSTLADVHLIDKEVPEDAAGIILISGPVDSGRLTPVAENLLFWLREKSKQENIPLLIEADGSRQKSFKAPTDHEPPIPDFSDIVLVTAGLSVLGKTLSEEHVHRPAEIIRLAGAGETITTQTILRVLSHPQGGLKNIPQTATRIAFLNQADTPELQSIAGQMAQQLLGSFDRVITGSLHHNILHTFEKTAAIILAAGESKRFGAPKALLEWKGKAFIRQIAETALQSGLEPVVIVTGSSHTEIESCLTNLPVQLLHNPNFAQGQSTSIKTGISALPETAGAAIFLLADQPQIPAEVLHALKAEHAATSAAIIAPLVLEERRANPVLFDRMTFKDLMNLHGDIGGRGIFDKHRVHYLPWHDDILLLDVDKPEDYRRLKEYE